MSGRRQFRISEVVQAVQQSDSNDSDDDDPLYENESDSDEDGSVHEDSNNEANNDDASSSDSDSGSPVRRRQRVTPQVPAATSPQLMGRNGHIWQANAPAPGQAVAANILRQQRGLTAASRDSRFVLDCFKLFITEDMIQLIVRETNRRARTTTREWNAGDNSNMHEWRDTDETEIYALVGLLVLAGVWRSSGESLDELWSSVDGRPIFRATMSLTRFKELLRFCRFDNQATRPQRLAVDKFAPVRDFWEMFLANTPLMYKPGSDMTIDEQLIATRGRCNFKQYIPSKPGKYGIKVFWICDSTTSYPLKGEVYLGRQPGAAANANNVKDLVKRLVRPWQNTGRNVTMDNYFTSTELATDLLAVRITIVGTMRKNRADIPPEMQADRQRVVQSTVFGFDRQLTLASYVQKRGKAVILLSSMHHNATIDETNNNKPDIILHYNNTKSGVDNLDHLTRLYTCKRKIKRWPMTIFFNIVDCAAVAAYVIWIENFQTGTNVNDTRGVYF